MSTYCIFCLSINRSIFHNDKASKAKFVGINEQKHIIKYKQYNINLTIYVCCKNREILVIFWNSLPYIVKPKA